MSLAALVTLVAGMFTIMLTTTFVYVHTMNNVPTHYNNWSNDWSSDVWDEHEYNHWDS